MRTHRALWFYNEGRKVLDLFCEVLEVTQLSNERFGNCVWEIVVGKLFQPTPSFPALQFLDSIEKGSNADKADLKQNDYVLEVRLITVVRLSIDNLP